MTGSGAASSRCRKASTTRTACRSRSSSPETVEKDAHGNVQLSGTGALADLLCEEIKSKLGIKRVRGDTFGYLQRSFAGCASEVDRREAREVGEFAVKQAIWGAGDGSVAIRRIGDYAVDYALVKLAEVAGKTKVMAGCVHRPLGQRRHSGLPGVSAAVAGQRPAAARPPARRRHRQGAEAVGCDITADHGLKIAVVSNERAN